MKDPIEIPITSSSLPSDRLRALVSECFLENDLQIRLESRAPTLSLRSPLGDHGVLIAVLAGGSASVSALVTGLLRIAEKKQDRTGKIVLKGRDGVAVEVPAGTPPEQLLELIVLAKKLDRPEIDLHL